MRITVKLMTIGFLVFASMAFGGTHDTPGIDQRQAIQEERIDRGVESGQLTGREAHRLDQRMDRVETIEEKAKADGTVTQQERKRLQKAINKNSKAIAKQKHDRQGKRHR